MNLKQCTQSNDHELNGYWYTTGTAEPYVCPLCRKDKIIINLKTSPKKRPAFKDTLPDYYKDNKKCCYCYNRYDKAVMKQIDNKWYCSFCSWRVNGLL